MSANLDELESTRGADGPQAQGDEIDRAAARQFVNRYCTVYQQKIALAELETLIKQARRHR